MNCIIAPITVNESYRHTTRNSFLDRPRTGLRPFGLTAPSYGKIFSRVFHSKRLRPIPVGENILHSIWGNAVASEESIREGSGFKNSLVFSGNSVISVCDRITCVSFVFACGSRISIVLSPSVDFVVGFSAPTCVVPPCADILCGLWWTDE